MLASMPTIGSWNPFCVRNTVLLWDSGPDFFLFVCFHLLQSSDGFCIVTGVWYRGALFQASYTQLFALALLPFCLALGEMGIRVHTKLVQRYDGCRRMYSWKMEKKMISLNVLRFFFHFVFHFGFHICVIDRKGNK